MRASTNLDHGGDGIPPMRSMPTASVACLLTDEMIAQHFRRRAD